MKRAFVIILLLLLLGLLLRAFQDGQSDYPSVYDRVMASGIVQVGVWEDNRPMSFMNSNGEWNGFEVDLAEAIAAQLGAELELMPVDETTRLTFVQEGIVDMSIAGLTHTRQRDEMIDFSITYFWDDQSFLVRKGTYRSVEELLGKTVAADAGSTAITSWKNYAVGDETPAADIVEFDSQSAAIQALVEGRVEGYAGDTTTLLMAAAGDPNLEHLPGGYNSLPYGIGLPADDSKWRDQVNVAMQELWLNGTYFRIYGEWFTGPDAVFELPLGGKMEIWADS